MNAHHMCWEDLQTAKSLRSCYPAPVGATRRNHAGWVSWVISLTPERKRFPSQLGFYSSELFILSSCDTSPPCSADKYAGSIKRFNVGNFKHHLWVLVTLILGKVFPRKDTNKGLFGRKWVKKNAPQATGQAEIHLMKH